MSHFQKESFMFYQLMSVSAKNRILKEKKLMMWDEIRICESQADSSPWTPYSPIDGCRATGSKDLLGCYVPPFSHPYVPFSAVRVLHPKVPSDRLTLHFPWSSPIGAASASALAQVSKPRDFPCCPTNTATNRLHQMWHIKSDSLCKSNQC